MRNVNKREFFVVFYFWETKKNRRHTRTRDAEYTSKYVPVLGW